MTLRRAHPFIFFRKVAMFSFLGFGLAAVESNAADGTWLNNTSGNWGNSSQWVGGVVANGTDSTAFITSNGSGFNITQNLTGLTLGGISSTTNATVNINTGSGGTINLATTIGTPTINNTNTFTINPTLTGTQGFVKTGNGRLTLGANNSSTLSGQISLNAGTTVLGNNGSFGAGDVTLNGGGINSGLSASGGVRSISNNLVWSSGSLTHDTSAGNSTSAIFRLNGTTSLLGASGNLISASPNAGLGNGFEFRSAVSGGAPGNSFGINNGGVEGNLWVGFYTANTFSHNITLFHGGTTPTDGLGKRGAVGLIVGHNNALSNATVTINNGVHRMFLASDDATDRVLGNNFNWTVNNASSGGAPRQTFFFGQYTTDNSTNAATPSKTVGGVGNVTINDFNVQANTDTIASTGRIIEVTNNTVATIAGNFTRSGTLAGSSMNLQKRGTGTLIIAGNASTYNGSFTVVAGTFQVNGTLGGLGVTVNGGRLGGTGTINGPVSITSNGTLAPGSSPGVLDFNDDLTVNGGTVEFELVANTTSGRGANFDGIDFLNAAADFNIASGSNFQIRVNQGSVDFTNAFWSTNQSWLFADLQGGSVSSLGNFTVSTTLDSLGNSATGYGSFALVLNGGDVYVEWTAIPEPSTYAMVLGGLAALVWLRRRRSNQG